ncbi:MULTISPECIES: H-NS histone family protein [unclassified Delftia]|uniref:H-NS histone family protein n=1 Tax=unclassified Delftia TaxID=2613839 RepID=UPI00190269D5|nr:MULTISPECIES: H-NS histone family protein [unclassified Delftia]MBK0115643.1 H-NS histone family protein [Delftia sp. S65]MBK0119500.1 H-NS histone family protein [Delftia sp. S67]MBK0130196.1 H-NS histone family protein [Delftia sp. S66]
MTPDYKTLLQQKAELEARIAEILKVEKADVIAKVRALVADYNLTADDVFSSGKRKSPVSAGVAKYRDPSTGATWTGRGKPPNWIKDAVDRTAFEI